MTSQDDDLSYCRDLVRNHDPDRYYVSLFAPEQARAKLWALFAFNQEVAKTRETVSEPVIGEIRLQWWREALGGITEGTPRAHPVVRSLAALPDFGRHHPVLLSIIDTRGQDLEPTSFADGESYVTYARATGGALMRTAQQVLDSRTPEDVLERIDDAGTAWALMAGLGALAFELGALPEQTTGQQRDQLVVDVVTRIETLVAHRKHSPAPASARAVLGLNALTRLSLERLRSHGLDPVALATHQPGGGRKLMALMAYHIWGDR